MKREIYLDAAFGDLRAAVLEDNTLCELIWERKTSDKLTETIFLGRVEQIRPSVGAAFIDIGQPLNAFLPLDEHQKLRCGDMIIVQGAAKQATQTKGLRVTSRINLAGKWLVLVPDGSGVHVSKKVKDPDLRMQLTEIGEEISPPDCGLIVRTASEDVTESALIEEATRLHAQWQSIRLRAKAAVKPCVLNERISLDRRLIRDLGGKDLSGVTTNDRGCFARLCQEKAEGRMPADAQIRLYEETTQLLFDVFSIEPQIDKALKKRVWLPCGGYLILDPCEAMTVIDVNSGKMTLGRNPEDTALRVNLEAADEIARQIRLRDIGGIIICDFIDMADPSHREMLVSHMKEAVKADRSAVKVEGITKLGLLEMTRKRVDDSLYRTLKTSCTYCAGDGFLLSAQEVAARAMRQVRRNLLSGQRGPFIIRCAPACAQSLAQYECTDEARVYVLSTASKHQERFEIEQIGEEVPVPKGAVAMNKGSEK